MVLILKMIEVILHVAHLNVSVVDGVGVEGPVLVTLLPALLVAPGPIRDEY